MTEEATKQVGNIISGIFQKYGIWESLVVTVVLLIVLSILSILVFKTRYFLKFMGLFWNNKNPPLNISDLNDPEKYYTKLLHHSVFLEMYYFHNNEIQKIKVSNCPYQTLCLKIFFTESIKFMIPNQKKKLMDIPTLTQTYADMNEIRVSIKKQFDLCNLPVEFTIIMEKIQEEITLTTYKKIQYIFTDASRPKDYFTIRLALLDLQSCFNQFVFYYSKNQYLQPNVRLEEILKKRYQKTPFILRNQ